MQKHQHRPATLTSGPAAQGDAVGQELVKGFNHGVNR
jgi:hypothetical protein